MDGKGLKTVMLGVLLVTAGSLVALPEAAAAASNKISCRDDKCFDRCLSIMSSIAVCFANCDCVLESGKTGPGDFPISNVNLLTNKEDIAIEYCKLGCRSSVCHGMRNVDGSGEMTRAAVERCGDACGRLCDGHAGAGAIASVAA